MPNFFPIANILVAVCLVTGFFNAGRNIVQTFSVADSTALTNLRPCPIDYLWELNIHKVKLDKNKIRYYADYYEHLLQVFPGSRDVYGILGYCYHFLNDEPKAIKFLEMATKYYPDYFWNYYNLAVIYINGSRYQEASVLLQKALAVDPMVSLKRMFGSAYVYGPLLSGPDEKQLFADTSKHIKNAYGSCFVLVGILNQTKSNKLAQELIKKFHLELYAF